MNLVTVFKALCSSARCHIILGAKRSNLKVRFSLDDKAVQVSICGNMTISNSIPKLRSMSGKGIFLIRFTQGTVRMPETGASISFCCSGNHFQIQDLQVPPRVPEMAVF